MNNVVLVENVVPYANPNTLRNKFSCFGQISCVGLHYSTTVRKVRNGYAFVKFAEANAAKQAVSENGYICVCGKRVEVSLLTDSSWEHPFFDAMSLALSEEPNFYCTSDDSMSISKAVDPVVHLLQNQKFQKTFLSSFSKSLIIKNINPAGFIAHQFVENIKNLCRILNVSIFWDYNLNTGFAFIEMKSSSYAAKVIKYMDNTVICGTKVKIVRPEKIFATVNFAEGMYLKNPLSLSSKSSDVLSSESLPASPQVFSMQKSLQKDKKMPKPKEVVINVLSQRRLNVKCEKFVDEDCVVIKVTL